MEKVVHLTDWAIIDWDGDKRILGVNPEQKFVRTSSVVSKLDDNRYQTQSGTIYVLDGTPNKEWSSYQK